MNRDILKRERAREGWFVQITSWGAIVATLLLVTALIVGTLTGKTP